MARTKLLKIKKYATLENAFDDATSVQGCWKRFFTDDNPITLELAAGHAELSLNLALKFPNLNFVAVDAKAHRLCTAAQYALDQRITNIAFLKSKIQNIANYFTDAIVKDIWITFPEPHLRRANVKHRLVHEDFISKYKAIASGDSLVHLKTDSPELYFYAVSVLHKVKAKIVHASFDLYASGVQENNVAHIKTKYERFFINMGRKIKYICFKLS